MIEYKLLKDENVLENKVLQHILDSLNELFCLYNEDLEILWANKAAAESLNLKKEELIGKHCYELWGQQNTPCLNCPVLKAVETQTPQIIEKQTPDGRYWQIHGSVVFNDENSIQYLVELGLDITDKKKVEIELQKNKVKLENLIKSSSEFIWQVDKNGVYNYVSDSANELIGYNSSEILGKTPFDFMEPSEAKRMRSIFSKIVRNTDKITHLEDVMVHKNGKSVFFETDGIPLFDEQGELNGYFGICRDISERKKNEESLKESEERFKKLSDLTFEGILIHNKGTVIDINQSLVNMFGYTREELIGRNIIQTLVPEKYHTVIKENISRNYAEPYEIMARRKDGTLIPVEIEARDIKHDNQKFRVAAIRDISQRKKAEIKLKESNQRLKEAEEIGRIGHVDWDVEKGKAIWSDMTFELYERDPSSGPPPYDEIMNLHVPEHAKKLEQMVRRALEKGEPYATDLKARLPSGKIAFYHAIGKPVMDSTGRVTNIRGIVQDITERVKSQEKIKSYNLFMDKIMDESPFAMLITDKDGFVIRTNKALRNKLHLTEEQIIGKYNVFNDENFDNIDVRSQIKSVFSNHEPARFDTFWSSDNVGKHVDFQNGVNLWIDVSVFPICNANGDLENVVCQWVDLTKLKEVTQALQESEEKYRTYIENAPEGVFIADSQSNFIEVNEKASEITGYDKHELLSMNINQITCDEFQTTALKDFQTLVDIGFVSCDHMFCHKEGGKHWWHVDGVKLSDDRYLVFVHDITDKKRMYLHLVKARKELKNILDATADGIRVVTSDFKVHSMNKTMSDLSGVPTDDGMDMFCYDMFKSDRCGTEECSLKKVLRTGHTSELQETRVNVMGEKIPCLCFSSPYTDEQGRIIGITEDFREISSLKKVEKELRQAHDDLQVLNKDLESKVEERTEKIKQLLQQKDDFINQLGHDLKNPLGPFMQLLPILKNHVTDGKDRRIIDVLDRNASYMKNLVNKTINLAKLNSDKTAFSFEILSLNRIVEEVIAVNIQLFEEYNIKVENRICSECQVFVDGFHIQEVFTNLFTNAVKYMGGPGKITVGCEITPKKVVVFVQDSGIGISAEHIDRLFDEYFKVDHSRHDFESSGLGLPICKRIVEKHGGKIWAESPGIGKGSTFYFTLPTSNE